jgi:hypothetical protein
MDIKSIIESPEFKKEITEAVLSGKDLDYFFDGEDEVPYERYEETLAIDAVLGVIKKYFLEDSV